jgi:DNA-binding NarL/FixJ family response regulator
MGSIRVLLADDHEVTRMSIKALLEQHPRLQVVAEVGSGEEAIAQALAHRPDVVVMEARMRGMSGLEACRKIVEQLPSTRVVLLTTFAGDELLFSRMPTGAARYVLKWRGSQDLVNTIEVVARGEAALELHGIAC